MSKRSTNTTTKSTDYPGKQYFDNAAKQFIWPIDHDDKQILVPENELHDAENDLMVQHFRKYGWHIQSCISVQHTKPFIAPKTPGPIFAGKANSPKEVVVKKSLYNPGDRFRIKSTECEVEIVRVVPKLHLKYTNRNKPDIISSEDQLTKVLNREAWERI